MDGQESLRMITIQTPTAKNDRTVGSGHRGTYCHPNRLRLKAKEPEKRQARVKGRDRGRAMMKRISKLGLGSRFCSGVRKSEKGMGAGLGMTLI